jgi:glutaminyl-peptide cyclotransferase
MHGVMRFFKLCGLLLGIVAGAGAHTAQAEVQYYDYSVVKVYPHDPEAFTEGLFYDRGTLFESTGLNGKSSVRQVSLETGKVLREQTIPSKYFGEGIAPWKGHVLGLTWQTGEGFVWGQKDFVLKSRFRYQGEGWGLTHTKDGLIMSDGTSKIKFINPNGFPNSLNVTRTIDVTLNGKPIADLNELEWINGEIFANVWQTDYIVRINAETGQITGVIDLKGLLAKGLPITQKVDVLNGIAYDSATSRLFVTGKFWPSLFEIKLVNRATGKIDPLK